MQDKPSGQGETAPVELEVKFRAGPDTGDGLFGSPLLAAAEQKGEEQLETRYFDSDDFALKRAGFDLRIRSENGTKLIQCLKEAASATSGPFSRPEYEAETISPVPDLALLPDHVRPRVAKVLGKAKLEARYETRIHRRTIEITHGASRIEVAFDAGLVMAGGKSEQISEVELELLSGNVADLLDLADSLATHFSLSLDFASKSAKGYRLANGSAPKPAKARPLSLPPKASRNTLLARLLANGLTHFTANWEALLRGDDPEAVHQLRVALRRLRCFLALLPDDELHTQLNRAAQGLARAMGPARNQDVFHEFLAHGPLAEGNDAPNAAALLALVSQRQGEARALARQALGGTAATLFVLALERRIIALQQDQTPGPSARVFARKALARLEERALRRGKTMPGLDGEQLHRLRIALKYLRYAAEALGPVALEKKELRKLVKATAALQELLGQRNDALQFKQLLDETGSAAGGKARDAVQFIAGWLAHARHRQHEGLEEAWRAFLKCCK